MQACSLFTIQVPNPFFEGRNRIYLIRSEPLTLIDTGIATQRAFDALVAGLREHGVGIRDIQRVVLTHKHIDHIGNAWRIQQASDAEILIHESEVNAVSEVDPDGSRFQDVMRRRLDYWKVPKEALSRASTPGFHWEIEAATPTGIRDGQRIELNDGELEVIHTPGHTRGSVCLKLGHRLLSGDHVLPDISPNVGAGDLQQRGLLQSFLNSLERTDRLAADIQMVYPGHGDAFPDLHQRCSELTLHHHQRLENIVGILAEQGPLPVFEIAQRLFGSLRDFHVLLGCAEAMSHLEYLMDRQRVVRDADQFAVL